MLYRRSSRSSSLRPFLLSSLLVMIMGAAGCRPAEPPAAPDAEAPTALTEPEEPAASEPRRAEVGVARQGRSLDDETGVGGVIAQPARSLFTVRERMVFDVQLPQAMQLFEATEGRKPRSREEFMQRIVEANQIQLPDLPAGSEYRYRPDEGELWVFPTE